MTRGKTGKIIAKTKKTITGKYAVDGPPMLCGLVAPACSKIRFPIVSRKNPRGLYPRQILSGEFGSCQSAYLGYPIKWQVNGRCGTTFLFTESSASCTIRSNF